MVFFLFFLNDFNVLKWDLFYFLLKILKQQQRANATMNKKIKTNVTIYNLNLNSADCLLFLKNLKNTELELKSTFSNHGHILLQMTLTKIHSFFLSKHSH